MNVLAEKCRFLRSLTAKQRSRITQVPHEQMSIKACEILSNEGMYSLLSDGSFNMKNSFTVVELFREIFLIGFTEWHFFQSAHLKKSFNFTMAIVLALKAQFLSNLKICGILILEKRLLNVPTHLYEKKQINQHL